jgi:hypothetical protein
VIGFENNGNGAYYGGAAGGFTNNTRSTGLSGPGSYEPIFGVGAGYPGMYGGYPILQQQSQQFNQYQQQQQGPYGAPGARYPSEAHRITPSGIVVDSDDFATKQSNAGVDATVRALIEEKGYNPKTFNTRPPNVRLVYIFVSP